MHVRIHIGRDSQERGVGGSGRPKGDSKGEIIEGKKRKEQRGRGGSQERYVIFRDLDTTGS